LVPHSIMFRLRPLSHHRPRRIEGAEPVPNVLEQEECATRAEHTHHLPPFIVEVEGTLSTAVTYTLRRFNFYRRHHSPLSSPPL
jgi:hypothetical protein